MSLENFVCWKCGASLADEPLPLARAAECRGCHTDLHVCKLCEFYDVRVANACREPIADRVVNKERANFCGYFKLKPGAYGSVEQQASAAAAARLGALFDLSPQADAATAKDTDAAKAALDSLFDREAGQD